MQKGKLYLVGLHIGNPDDMSFRINKYIKEAKNLVIEREEAFERVLPNLFKEKTNSNIISIECVCENGTPIDEKERVRTEEVIDLLNSGEDVYMISDEGMPGAADPGMHIITSAIKNKIEIKATPGPSVLVAAAAVTGVIHNFTFESFMPPQRTQRIAWLIERKSSLNPMVIVLRNMAGNPINGVLQFSNEIPEFFEDAIEIFGQDRKAALCYNLTKDDEFVVRGTLRDLQVWFLNKERSDKYQITLVVDNYQNNRLTI